MIPKKHEDADIIISDVANGDKNNNGTSPKEIVETIETLEEGIVTRKGPNEDTLEINVVDTKEMNLDVKKNTNLINQTVQKLINEKLEFIQNNLFKGITKQLEKLEDENTNLRKRERILRARISNLENKKKVNTVDQNTMTISTSFVPSTTPTIPLQVVVTTQTTIFPEYTLLSKTTTPATVPSLKTTTSSDNSSLVLPNTQLSTVSDNDFVPGIFRSVPTLEVKPYQPTSPQPLTSQEKILDGDGVVEKYVSKDNTSCINDWNDIHRNRNHYNQSPPTLTPSPTLKRRKLSNGSSNHLEELKHQRSKDGAPLQRIVDHPPHPSQRPPPPPHPMMQHDPYARHLYEMGLKHAYDIRIMQECDPSFQRLTPKKKAKRLNEMHMNHMRWERDFKKQHEHLKRLGMNQMRHRLDPQQNPALSPRMIPHSSPRARPPNQRPIEVEPRRQIDQSMMRPPNYRPVETQMDMAPVEQISEFMNHNHTGLLSAHLERREWIQNDAERNVNGISQGIQSFKEAFPTQPSVNRNDSNPRRRNLNNIIHDKISKRSKKVKGYVQRILVETPQKMNIPPNEETPSTSQPLHIYHHQQQQPSQEDQRIPLPTPQQQQQLGYRPQLQHQQPPPPHSQYQQRHQLRQQKPQRPPQTPLQPPPQPPSHQQNLQQQQQQQMSTQSPLPPPQQQKNPAEPSQTPPPQQQQQPQQPTPESPQHQQQKKQPSPQPPVQQQQQQPLPPQPQQLQPPPQQPPPQQPQTQEQHFKSQQQHFKLVPVSMMQRSPVKHPPKSSFPYRPELSNITVMQPPFSMVPVRPAIFHQVQMVAQPPSTTTPQKQPPPPPPPSYEDSQQLPRILTELSVTSEGTVLLTWNCTETSKQFQDRVRNYLIFTYTTPQDDPVRPPKDISLWKRIGEVGALPLPIACSLSNLMDGKNNYFFTVIPVDKKGVLGVIGNVCALKKT